MYFGNFGVFDGGFLEADQKPFFRRRIAVTFQSTIQVFYFQYRRKNTATPNLVEWRMAPPQKKPLVRPQEKPHGVVRRASEKRPLAPMKVLSEFHVAR